MPGPLSWKPSDLARILFFALFLFMAAAFESSAQQAVVRVNVPEKISGNFYFTIDIDNVIHLDSGQFDLRFDPDAIRVMDVKDGNIGDITVPVDLWTSLKPGSIRVLFNFPGVQGISGTGHLAKIKARAIGKTGNITVLDIYGGMLVDQEANSIPADWVNNKMKIEESAPGPDPDAVPRSEQASDPGIQPQGISISTPLAVGGLVVLAAIPSLFLILYRRRSNKA